MQHSLQKNYTQMMARFYLNCNNVTISESFYNDV